MVSKDFLTDLGSVTSQASARPPMAFAIVSAAFRFRSSIATCAPSAANAFAVAAPIPEPPPVTITILRCRGFSSDFPSLACSSDQYSMSKKSYSGIGWKRPMASASVITAILVSARSAAIAAALAELPKPKSPKPGTKIIRGKGSSSIFLFGAILLFRLKYVW